jgi:hypothetical protein
MRVSKPLHSSSASTHSVGAFRASLFQASSLHANSLCTIRRLQAYAQILSTPRMFRVGKSPSSQKIGLMMTSLCSACSHTHTHTHTRTQTPPSCANGFLTTMRPERFKLPTPQTFCIDMMEPILKLALQSRCSTPRRSPRLWSSHLPSSTTNSSASRR